MAEQNAVEPSSYNATEDYSGGDYGNSDFDSSESEGAGDEGQPGPGMGQSKSSRRRSGHLRASPVATARPDRRVRRW
jgi:hypothetical protein